MTPVEWNNIHRSSTLKPLLTDYNRWISSAGPGCFDRSAATFPPRFSNDANLIDSIKSTFAGQPVISDLRSYDLYFVKK